MSGRLRLVIFTAVLLGFLSRFPAGAEQYRVAVLDFSVQSNNPDLTYVGKGFAEFVSIELSKSREVTLISRDKRNRILEEQEFSLSDLTDSDKQIAVGSLLAANYLLMGSVYDFAGELNIVVQLVSAETGEIVFQDKVGGRLEQHGYLTGSMAAKVLRYLHAQVPETVAAKVEAEAAGEKEVAVRFSRAIDAYDRKDTSLAKQELFAAKRIAPENEAVNYYINKLIFNTAKFKPLAEKYIPNQYPYFLGLIEYDKIYYLSSANLKYILGWDNPAAWYRLEDYDLDLANNAARLNLGYQLPIGKNLGIEADVMVYFENNTLRSSSGDEVYTAVRAPGAILSIGWSPLDLLSIGASFSLYYQYWSLDGWQTTEKRLRTAYSGGVLLKNRTSTVLFDLLCGYSSEEMPTIDPVAFVHSGTSAAPLFAEGTLTITNSAKRLFLILKESNDIYLERPYYIGRLIPAIEYWVAEWLSLRTGIEGALQNKENEVETGIGIVSGISFRLPKKGWDFDISFSYRRGFSRGVEGQFIYEPLLYMSISKTGLFTSRN